MSVQRILILACAIVVAVTPVVAAPRTFVSATGSDANPCSRDLPCRTFGAAIIQTNDGGEIVALDSAGYGPVLITKNVTLVAPQGVYAGITAAAGQIPVAIQAAGADVILRNLSLNGGTFGIQTGSSAPASLLIEHCTITAPSAAGIYISVGTPSVIVNDTVISHCGADGVFSGSAELSMNRCVVARNYRGIRLDGGTASIRDTVLESNESYGLWTQGSSGYVYAALDDVIATHNAVGIFVDTGSVTMQGGGAMHNRNAGIYLLKMGSGPPVFIAKNAQSSHNDRGVWISGAGEATLSDCTLAANTIGVFAAESTAVLRLARNTFSENTVGVDCWAGPSVRSTLDNTFHSNTVDTDCAQPFPAFTSR